MFTNSKRIINLAMLTAILLAPAKATLAEELTTGPPSLQVMGLLLPAIQKVRMAAAHVEVAVRFDRRLADPSLVAVEFEDGRVVPAAVVEVNDFGIWVEDEYGIVVFILIV